jgi:hypothetical protein
LRKPQNFKTTAEGWSFLRRPLMSKGKAMSLPSLLSPTIPSGAWILPDPHSCADSYLSQCLGALIDQHPAEQDLALEALSFTNPIVQHRGAN